MVLTLHHLGISQSERIVFLLEELGVEYNLKRYARDPIGAPDSLKNLPGNQTGKSPFFEDSEAGITLNESGAISDYILGKYAHEGGRRLIKTFGENGYVDYIYFYNFANATFHPALSRLMFLKASQLPEDNAMVRLTIQHVAQALTIIDSHLKNNKWLAGDDFTAADCMIVYSLSSNRYFGPRRYDEYPNIVRYLGDIGNRPAYQRAMSKGDPEMKLLLGVEGPEQSLMQVGGVKSDIWKKE